MKVLFLLSIIALSQNCFAGDLKMETIASVLSSLRCQQKDAGKILEPLRALRTRKSDLAKVGIGYSSTGEEMDENIVVKFKEPIKLYGASSHQVEMFIDGGEFILYGDFRGDQRVAIEKTGMKQIDPRNKGDFVKPVSSELCAPSIRLRKLGPNRFRFGCGWCNGG